MLKNFLKRRKQLIQTKLELKHKERLNKIEEKLKEEKAKENKRELEKHFNSLFSYSLEKSVKRSE